MANEVTIHVKTKDDTTVVKITDKVEREFKKSGEKSGRSFGSSIKRWFAGEGGGLFRQIGQSGGTFFGSGLLGALKTPILGPLLLAVIGGVTATVMPAVGAIAGGALVAGFGAGIAGLGIVFAAQSQRVGHVWSQTMSDLGADMRLLAVPFESTLIHIAGFFRRTVDAFNPVLAKAFSQLAGPVERFADRSTRALEGLIPAIGPITEAFTGVLDALGPAMQDAVRSLSDGMINLARSVSRNPDALADTVRELGSFIEGALDLITTLNDVNTSFTTLTGGLSLVEVTFGLLMGPIMMLNSMFGHLGKAIDLVNAAVGRTGKDVDGAGKSMSDAAAHTVKLAQGLKTTEASAQHALPPLNNVTNALVRQKKQFSEAIDAMSQWTSKALASSNAAIAYEAAVDDATRSIKDNGKTLDINTEKGRNNRTALNNIAEAANRQVKAMDDAGASNVAVARTAESARARFITFATQMGLSKTAAQKLARELINIPNVSREAKLLADKRDLDRKLAAARTALADKNLTRARTAALRADIRQLLRQKAAAQAAIDRLRGKTVTIRSRYIEERIIRQQTGGSGGRAPGFAHGGITSSGISLVGEHGPELAELAPGTRIRTAGTTRQLARQAAAGSPGSPLLVRVDSTTSSGLERIFLDWLQGALRKTPGVKLV